MYLTLFVMLFMARAASLDLVCGLYHNCVFEKGQEAMKCWGYNNYGQLGYDDTNNRGDGPNEMGANLIFVHIGTGFVVEDMKLGGYHSCAKSVDRAMKCFGDNRYAELGFYGVTTTGDALPFLVFGADCNLSKIAAGDLHTCALSTDAALKCFGYNAYGQCGAGTTTNPISGPPSQITAIDLGTNFTAVDVQIFGYQVCVKSQQGTAKCFGWNNAGQLGYSDTTDRGQTPESMGDGLPIVNLGSDFIVAAIATGAYHSCALSTTTKTVKCWGCGGSENYAYNVSQFAVGGDSWTAFMVYSVAGSEFENGVDFSMEYCSYSANFTEYISYKMARDFLYGKNEIGHHVQLLLRTSHPLNIADAVVTVTSVQGAQSHDDLASSSSSSSFEILLACFIAFVVFVFIGAFVLWRRKQRVIDHDDHARREEPAMEMQIRSPMEQQKEDAPAVHNTNQPHGELHIDNEGAGQDQNADIDIISAINQTVFE